MSQIIRSETTNYAVEKLVGRTPGYNVYVVRDASSGAYYLLKIAPDVLGNGLLDREAFLLSQIYEEIERRDAEYQRTDGNDKSLGYQRCFPRLVESFLVPDQGNRRVNIIAIHGTSSISDLVPIEQWRTREKRRIDPKSSAWIMGRLLKIFTLTHPMGVAMGKIDGGNILVNPIEHHAVLFDWTQARYNEGPLPKEVAREEISQATLQVFLALGGNLLTGELPSDEQLQDTRYADYLMQLIRKRVDDPFEAGEKLYALLDQIWERGFHPFTTAPL